MKFIHILLIFFTLMVGKVYADTIIVDTSGWDQGQINMIQAASVSLLFKNGINYDSISVINNKIDIKNPSTNPSSLLTSSNIKAEAVSILNIAEQNRLADVAKQDAKDNELRINELSNLNLSNVDTRINSINNVSDIKILLKALVRYIKAKERE